MPRRKNPLKYVGVLKLPNRSQPLVGRKFTILSVRVEEVLLLNKFFSDCRYMPQLRRYGPTNVCNGAEMPIFLRPVFAASRVQRISDLHSKFRTKAAPRAEVW